MLGDQAMRVIRWAMLSSIAVLLSASVQAAEMELAPSPPGNGAAAQGPPDAAATTPFPAGAQAAATDTTASAGTPQAAVAPDPAPGPAADPKPWKLPQPCLTQELGIDISGWLEPGVTLNTLSPRDRWNGPVATNDRSNDFELNQFWLAFVRPVKTDGDGFDIGGRVDLSYGTDWRYGDSPGLEQRIDYQHQLYGLILPQMYVEVGIDDLTIRLGHYAASIGYEIVPAPANFFYSHSYAMGYSEPILVTGGRAEYKLSDNWSVNAGLNDGWGNFEDPDNALDFLGGVNWQNDEKTTSLSYQFTFGREGIFGHEPPTGTNQIYDGALVFKEQLTKKLLYVAQNNMGFDSEGDLRTGGFARWYGLAQYLIYTINPKLSAGTRIEWFRDEEGSRVAGVGNLNYGWMGAPGFAGTFTELTFGLNYRPNLNFVIRPEIRCDWYSGSTNVDGQLPFGDGTRSQQLLLATDMIFTF
jgi:hypothetical protein